MKRLPVLFGLMALVMAVLVSAGATQDTKKEDKKEVKFKPALPAGFKGLGLSKDQIQKIYTVQKEYHAKIVDLQAKLDEMKDARSKEEFKVLTDDQREKYLKSKGVDIKGKDKDKDKDKDKK
jgi:hypothetical protein